MAACASIYCYGVCYLSMPTDVPSMTSTHTRTRADADKIASRGLLLPLWSLALPVIALLIALLVVAGQPDGRLHMWVLDVGQGDAILLRTPQGHTALVDGGPGATSLLNGLGAHLPLWQHSLDMVVLTHPHQDHMMGLPELLDRYGVAEVVQTEFSPTVGIQAEWAYTLKSKSITVHYARRGERISFDGEPDLWLDVLSPITPSAAQERHTRAQGDDVNNTSVVLQLHYGAHSIMLEGDAQAEAEAQMVRYEGADLRSTVLKVGHHGSATSSSASFLATTGPKVAIISVGADNKFGHPASQTLNALQQTGALIYRTDQNGTVEVVANKSRIWVRSER